MDQNLYRSPVKAGMLILCMMCLLLATGGYGYAQSVKKAKGLNFLVPEDWPVEKRGGIVAPIPTEEYVAIKFKAIEEEFQAVKDELSDKFVGFQSDLKNMEETFSKAIKKTQSQSESQEETGEDLTGVLSDLKLLQSELGRLDRKITNKGKEMQDQSEKMTNQIKSVEEKIKNLQTKIYKLDEKVDYIEEQQEGSY